MVPKYRKKKESNTSKSNKKANHKHEFIDCLLIDEKHNNPHKSSYCKICGKIDGVCLLETEKTNSGYRKMLSNEEIFEKYKDLPQFRVNSVFDKYVSI